MQTQGLSAAATRRLTSDSALFQSFLKEESTNVAPRRRTSYKSKLAKETNLEKRISVILGKDNKKSRGSKQRRGSSQGGKRTHILDKRPPSLADLPHSQISMTGDIQRRYDDSDSDTNDTESNYERGRNLATLSRTQPLNRSMKMDANTAFLNDASRQDEEPGRLLSAVLNANAPKQDENILREKVLALQRNYSSVTGALRDKHAELSASKSENADLMMRLQDMREDAIRQSSLITAAEKREADAMAKLREANEMARASDGLHIQLKEAETTVLDLQGWKEDLMGDLRHLRSELNDANEREGRLIEELEARPADEDLQAAVENATELENVVQRTSNELQAERMRTKELALSLARARNQSKHDQAGLETLTRDAKRFTTLLRTEQKRREEAENTANALTAQIAEQEANMALMEQERKKFESQHNATLQTQFDTLLADKINLEKDYETLKGNLTENRKLTDTQRSEIAKLQTQLNALHAVSVTARRLQEEARNMVAERDALQKTNAELMVQNASLMSSSDATVEEHADRITLLEKNNLALNSQVADLQKALAQSEKNLRAAQAETDIVRKDAQKALDNRPPPVDLDAHGKKIRDEMDAMYGEKLTTWENTVARMGKQLMESQNECASLKTALASVRPKSVQQVDRKTEPSADELLKHADVVRRERELQAVLAKLLISETSLTGNFTCALCLELFNSPVTCIPCGHSYCKDCLEQKGFCIASTCGKEKQISYYQNDLLEDLKNKFIFRKQTLSGLVAMNQSDKKLPSA